MPSPGRSSYKMYVPGVFQSSPFFAGKVVQLMMQNALRFLGPTRSGLSRQLQSVDQEEGQLVGLPLPPCSP